eukprot:TRINITY_DN26855_c0_g1_i1.p1 TRINITY_DN26855_c0_g1~~TRINITY_DN26855_c0_g1_i1.p1  ORF type:complete len:322 (+),score=76.17 TRINITY_DN26855_c0_g1_i1:844-1809(+)
MLLPYFEQPNNFSHHVLQISWEMRKQLLELYYGFDENFIRHFLGKKISKIQKELEQTAEKLKIRLASCERQADNLKRAQKIAEGEDDRERERDGKHSMLGSVYHIQQVLQISEQLAKKYARILFLAKYRVDTNRKRIHQFTYHEIDLMTSYIMQHWTLSYVEDELDCEFTERLKDLKSEFGNGQLANKYRAYIEQYFKESISEEIVQPQKLRLLLEKVPSILKSLATVASSMPKGKELQNFLPELDDLSTIFHKMSVTEQEADCFLKAILATADYCSPSLSKDGIVSTWKKYLTVVIPIMKIMLTRFGAVRRTASWKGFRK